MLKRKVSKQMKSRGNEGGARKQLEGTSKEMDELGETNKDTFLKEAHNGHMFTSQWDHMGILVAKDRKEKVISSL
ncbi:unnamed protein product [Ilex paraguariensis]|uniref:Uncharacterized protein n=1 Tax=Ilex paraguariensis TaxID=185542 RepID=A0ABC8SN47_9AQUA